MTNDEKAKLIRPWIDPEERVTVQFRNESSLNAEVTGVTDQVVDLLLDTRMVHMRQSVAVPLSRVRVSEDLSHYTRDPDRPLKRRRLMLVIDEDRPPITY
ncbi:hypothetical protein [Candidatus Nitrospira bockiana]